METGILHLHNLLRWVVLIFGIIVLIKSFNGMSSKRKFLPGDRKSMLFLLISCDLQLLLGLALYFIGPWGVKNISNLGMGEVMRNPVNRFFAIEHTIGMLVAIILVHVAFSTAKKDMDDTRKFKSIFTTVLIAFILVLISIPWPFREGLGRALFPGM